MKKSIIQKILLTLFFVISVLAPEVQAVPSKYFQQVVFVNKTPYYIWVDALDTKKAHFDNIALSKTPINPNGQPIINTGDPKRYFAEVVLSISQKPHLKPYDPASSLLIYLRDGVIATFPKQFIHGQNIQVTVKKKKIGINTCTIPGISDYEVTIATK